MVRLAARLVLAILANTVGLLVASLILANFSISAGSFIVAVLVFSICMVVLGPFVLTMAVRYAPFLVGGIALVTTLVGLIITSLLTDGLHISGLSTWVLATLIVWIFSIAAQLVLPLIMFKKFLGNAKERRGHEAAPSK